MVDFSFENREEEFRLDDESIPGRSGLVFGFEPSAWDKVVAASLFDPKIAAQRQPEGEFKGETTSEGSQPPPAVVSSGSTQPLRGPTKLSNLTFSSKSEAVCGLMLEKYIPGFQLIAGETFQVAVGSKRFDFKVVGVFIEFHPVQLRHDFTSQNAYQKFLSALGRLPEWQRSELADILHEEFAGQYAKRRRDVLNSFEQTKSAELVVCHDRGDFVRRVIRRFGGAGVPSETKLLREFEALYRRMQRRFHQEDC